MVQVALIHSRHRPDKNAVLLMPGALVELNLYNYFSESDSS